MEFSEDDWLGGPDRRIYFVSIGKCGLHSQSHYSSLLGFTSSLFPSGLEGP